MTAPIPKDEKERLKALRRYKVLDTPEEQEYDDFTLLAKELCDVPIALITLVDRDRQWFKSAIGLNTAETPRDASICAYTIMSNAPEVFVVADASRDERFADNPLVKGDPRIRFYAGVPLVTPDHQSIGSLCVIDRKPRKLNNRTLTALQALGRQVMTRLELRQATNLLKAANNDLQKLSLTDDLTGLFNRRGFMFHAEQQLKLFYTRKIPLDLWLLLGDMDNLKKTNDTFGHQEGSFAIKKTGEIIRESFRDTDIIARIGGDEFGGFIINARPNAGRLMTARLENNLQEFNSVSGKPYALSASFGLLLIDSALRLPIEELLNQADALMYENKRAKTMHR